eukprot:CAMPEP_0174896518 /NCGR_PEP_ID=MMETSP0167-20121228/10688_1 /TAXON_ID=38298 /ORGANISM="Rhodella maculata, Strain CCMP736" /LENGTH=30 /DNA_ID= /DNA_START= /DNA_END= /DNA_ORIENTATION=
MKRGWRRGDGGAEMAARVRKHWGGSAGAEA